MTRLSESQKAAITETMAVVKSHLNDALTVSNLEAAKSAMVALCARQDLFTFEDFPVQETVEEDVSYLIHMDPDGGYALYVNSGIPGQTSCPHDHGGAWAIVSAVRGEETHYMYQPTDAQDKPLDLKATLVCRPGHAVSLMPDGVHEIEAKGDAPLLHLHLYGKAFEYQDLRTEYDKKTHAPKRFKMENFGRIVDCR